MAGGVGDGDEGNFAVSPGLEISLFVSGDVESAEKLLEGWHSLLSIARSG